MPVASFTRQQKALVQKSFDLLMPEAKEVAETFYKRLFEIAPDTRQLFHGDIHEQGTKFMQMFSVIVGGLDMITDLVPMLESLGEGHAVRYGVRKEHYDLLGQALLYSLEQHLGESFTPETREAWAALYNMMAEAAKSNAYKA